jgi:hypothetical protein
MDFSIHFLSLCSVAEPELEPQGAKTFCWSQSRNKVLAPAHVPGSGSDIGIYAPFFKLLVST